MPIHRLFRLETNYNTPSLNNYALAEFLSIQISPRIHPLKYHNHGTPYHLYLHLYKFFSEFPHALKDIFPYTLSWATLVLFCSHSMYKFQSVHMVLPVYNESTLYLQHETVLENQTTFHQMQHLSFSPDHF